MNPIRHSASPLSSPPPTASHIPQKKSDRPPAACVANGESRRKYAETNQTPHPARRASPPCPFPSPCAALSKNGTRGVRAPPVEGIAARGPPIPPPALRNSPAKAAAAIFANPVRVARETAYPTDPIRPRAPGLPSSSFSLLSSSASPTGPEAVAG